MFGSVFETNDCAKHFKLAKLSSKSHKKKGDTSAFKLDYHYTSMNNVNSAS